MVPKPNLRAWSVFFVVHLTLTVGGLSQESSNFSPNPTGGDIAIVPLTFKDDATLPNLPASPVMSYPIRCATDGTAYLEMLQPPDFQERRWVAVSATAVNGFALQGVTDLKHIEAIDYFPSKSQLTLLVHAAKGEEEVTRTITLPNGETRQEKGPKSEIHAYAVRFDGTGRYQGATELDGAIEPERIAVFPSGDFLIWGLDVGTKLPRLAMMKSTGEILSYLDVPRKFDNDMIEQDNRPTRIGIRSMLGFREGILLIRPLAATPLLWVRESGAVETLSLKVPEGFVIDSILPSDADLYVRLRRVQTKADASAHKLKGEPQLYQFNREDGRPIARLTVPEFSVAELACVIGGQFIAFRRNSDGNLVRMIGH